MDSAQLVCSVVVLKGLLSIIDAPQSHFSVVRVCEKNCACQVAFAHHGLGRAN